MLFFLSCEWNLSMKTKKNRIFLKPWKRKGMSSKDLHSKKNVLHIKALKKILFVSNQMTQYFFVRSFYYRQLIYDENII